MNLNNTCQMRAMVMVMVMVFNSSFNNSVI